LVTREWHRCNHDFTTNCWTKLGKYPAALRSRTITSAGMNRVEARPDESFYDQQTDTLWLYVQRDYGIFQDQALAVSLYMQSNFGRIVEDNLNGQW